MQKPHHCLEIVAFRAFLEGKSIKDAQSQISRLGDKTWGKQIILPAGSMKEGRC